MKIISTCLVLLIAGVHGIAVREAFHTANIDHDGADLSIVSQNNHNGWANPEDLAPMPQCIAQQDQSIWLSAMTKCTSKRCTSHFIICTHHQWLTELSCLSNEFSTEVVKSYFPYCGRSILAKAQLYQWIRTITGRTWLIDVGDANGLQDLSPASLAKGYAAVDVIYNAPTCLTGSVSAASREPFHHVIASCGFTGTTQHTGNAARPWEYNAHLRSMVALDYETVGYNLVGRRVRDGDYFDKDCFCNAFTIDLNKEPCSGSAHLDFTKERLWLHATCGSASLPHNWANNLKTTQYAYIPIKDWHWPMCVADMPKQVIKLTDQCATDACEVDSSGYCKVTRAVDRACFCRNISYDSCGGSCHIFENRMDYIKWLHELCGNVQGWHGLPDNWRQLAAPSPTEMVPWRWTVKPSNDSDIGYIASWGHTRATEPCTSNEWKLGSFALINIATFLAVYLSQRRGIPPITWYSTRLCWFKGALIAALQLLANLVNSLIVQSTHGYENVPVTQLMLLWCSMPRPAWLTVLLIGLIPLGAVGYSAVVPVLLAEMILQSLSLYYMVMTVDYGLEHGFYLGGLEGVAKGGVAETMYAGALMWLSCLAGALVQSAQAIHKMNRMAESGSPNPPEWQRDNQALFAGRTGRDRTAYGTFTDKGQQHDWVSQKTPMCATVMVVLLWIAQWLFWAGFIGLSSEEFCPPKLEVLTGVWIAASLMGIRIALI
ncbi:hypothetical protein BJX63DRAFT_121278 [Aspergillus granulosus]|uniref:Uncharacterized protein n=1 Tax=Aspergillus granulosus TaxID=176169 RepID=A0ABR4I3T3_9EURO